MQKAVRFTVVGAFCAFLGWGMHGTGAAPAESSPLPEPSPPRAMARPAEAAPSARRSGPPARAVAITPPGEGATRALIGANEVTVARFRACVAAGACKAEQFAAGEGSPCNWDVAGRDEHPMNCVDWVGASAFCEFDGGRLCKPDEWFAACRGPSDWDYPYGTAFDAKACLARPGPATEVLATEPAGSRASCAGGRLGPYDMGGNVSEWVDECDGTYCHFNGGAYLTNEPVELFASCKRVCAGNQKTFRSATIGIRCCYDPRTGDPA